MEVHKHPHHVMHKKKWGEYLLEFLMIFLAVTAGFFAESIREHIVEKALERTYVKSLDEDLQMDITNNEAEIKSIQNRIVMIDSLEMLLNSNKPGINASDIYYLSREIQRVGFVGLNDRTLVQLRNAGGMRVIQNMQVVDSIFYYYKDGQFKDYAKQLIYSIFRETDPIFSEIFDGNEFDKILDSSGGLLRISQPLTLRSYDPKTISSYILVLSKIKSISLGVLRNNKTLIREAKNLRAIISKNYKI